MTNGPSPVAPGRASPPAVPAPPAVSVVIPTRNRIGLVQEAARSVLAQSAPALELIVVDDASEDGTAAWIRDATDVRTHGITLPRHQERSSARNVGLRQATGRYTLFLDDDDRLRPGALGALAAVLDRHPQSVAAVGGMALFDDGGVTQRLWHPRRRITLADPWLAVLFDWSPFPSQTLWRTQALHRVGGWDPALTVSEDVDLNLRMARVGAFEIVPTRVVDYRLHPGQVPRPVDMDAVNDGIRARFVETLSGGDRELAQQVVEARAHSRRGDMAFTEARTAQALWRYGHAVHAWPALLKSPLSRHGIVVNALKCMLGRRLLRRARRIWATARPPQPQRTERASAVGG